MDPFNLMMVAVLALMVVFMIRNSRKQKADREALMAKVVKGANVMTTSGIFGTILSIDVEDNEILLETTPGTKIRIHRQAVTTVVEKAAPVVAVKNATAKPAAKKPAATKSATK
ncbi:MAG: preprotein translocase subunit YajC [Actinomycetota bacterium]|jgi:preprotein translocase subunit YajC